MPKPRFNTLDGKSWTRYSISVWDDIKKTLEEKRLKHPAMFPVQLVERVVECYTQGPGATVLDPFVGSGSTLVGALSKGRRAIGFDISPDYLSMAERRCLAVRPPTLDTQTDLPDFSLHQASALEIGEHVPRESIDLCFTSPPYWQVLKQKRTADHRETRHYGDQVDDLGGEMDYAQYLELLKGVAAQVLSVLKPGAFFILNVMDLRRGPIFYPLHMDAANLAREVGFLFDDLIIWNRAHEYNSLRPLGYPYMFRINKVHEYLLIFRKPV